MDLKRLFSFHSWIIGRFVLGCRVSLLFYISNAFLTSISRRSEAMLWIFLWNAVVSYVNDFINTSKNGNGLYKLTWTTVYKTGSKRNKSVVLGSIEKHDLESQLSSTRGRKGDLANVFRRAKDGEGHLFCSPSFLVKYFFHIQSISSHVKRIILLNISSKIGKTILQIEIDFKLLTLMVHAP